MSTALPVVPPPARGPVDEQAAASRLPPAHTSPADSQATTQMDAPSTAASLQSERAPAPTHHRFVLTDHVALQLLEQDPAITVLVRRQKLEGYEVYLVEQWACSRDQPTFVITTYSGDPKDAAWGSILSLPTDENTWSPMVRAYFKALHTKCYARRTETKYGTLMVTNLGAFPQALTVIPVPDGDAKKNRELFFVNVDLKRLGCSGRLGIKLASPNSATQAKYHQLYRTSDKVPLNSSVIELVRMCQIALVLFAKLDPAYADGLLCDCTEKAINDWWLDFGAEYYTVEPHDGILGPTTVAALLGMLIGARNRLSAHNAPVPKDVFDVEATKRAISHFQKSQRIQRTGLLDHYTYNRLRRVTAKAASKEGWNMPRALKSTVAELGGKGGEMVMGMVGADKAGIADVETVDIDRFVDLVHGERAKWLWLGKPRKTNTVNMFNRLPDDASSPDSRDNATTKLLRKEVTNEEQKQRKREAEANEVKKLQEATGAENLDKEKDPFSKRAAIKRATEKIESGTGFHRIKDAVGRRNHHHKTSKDETSNEQSLHYTKSQMGRVKSKAGSTDLSLRRTQSTEANFAEHLTNVTAGSTATPPGSTLDGALEGTAKAQAPERPSAEANDVRESDSSTVDGSIAGSIKEDLDNLDDERLPFDANDSTPIPLRRTQSADPPPAYRSTPRNDNYYPRHLSFSIAEESVLTWPPVLSIPDAERTASDAALPLSTRLASLDALSATYQALQSRLTDLSTLDTSWTSATVTSILDLDVQASSDVAELEQMYLARLDDYQVLREDAKEIIAHDRRVLLDAIRDLETLGAKLDYEIQGVRGKVDDVLEGVEELERQVEGVEERVGELEGVLGGLGRGGIGREREGWGRWGVRMLTGLGSLAA